MRNADTRPRWLATAFFVAVAVGIAPLPFVACSGQNQASGSDQNPAAPGFNSAQSDAGAIALADRTMQAMGGRHAWDETRYIAWSFFGRRSHVWDKYTGDVRIEYAERDTNQPVVVLMNINTKAGKAWVGGEDVTEPAKLQPLLQSGYEIWVNDGYWLLMPYKLKDSGVTLKHLGERATDNGRAADVIQLTFSSVGVTPENKYEVYIAKDDGLVGQWSYFAKATDEKPSMTTPWRDWQRYGRIMLSGDRGERNGRSLRLENIRVFDELPRSVFINPER